MSSCSLKSKTNTHPTSLTIWSDQEIIHDPIIAKTSEQYFFTSLENKTLFSLDSKGEIVNNLVENYTVSKDALSTTIKLNGDKFSDDVMITSSDVKASLSRVMLVGGDYSNLLTSIKGSGEAKNGSDFFGITTPDDKTVVISLILPDPLFVYHLTHPATAILPASSIGEKGKLTFDGHSGDYTASVITNEIDGVTQYDPRIGSLPVIRVIHKTREQIKAEPNKNDADIILGASGSSVNYYQSKIYQLAQASWNIYVENPSSPFSNIKFRQAILMALDNKQLIAPYDERAVVPTSLTGPTIDSLECKELCISNVDKSKKLIRELYPNGDVPEVSITIEDNAIQHSLATSVQEQLNEIGVSSSVKSYNVTELSNVIARGDVELFRYGWVSQVPIGAILLSQNYKADSTENISGLADEFLNASIKQYLSSTTAQQSLKRSRDIQERLRELYITRPIAQFTKVITVNKRIDHVQGDCFGRLDIKKIQVR